MERDFKAHLFELTGNLTKWASEDNDNVEKLKCQRDILTLLNEHFDRWVLESYESEVKH